MLQPAVIIDFFFFPSAIFVQLSYLSPKQGVTAIHKMQGNSLQLSIFFEWFFTLPNSYLNPLMSES